MTVGLKRPRLLDLFCCAGGAAVGYHRAGFDVTGVDIAPQPRFPYMTVVQADVMDVLADVKYLRSFDAIHASPPCQAYTSLRALSSREHPRLIEPVREALQRTGLPFVIENVVGAPLIDPVTLCGSMFGLGLGEAVLKRHRLFESTVSLRGMQDACRGRKVVGVYGAGGAWTRVAPGGGGVKVSGPDAALALGIDWHHYQPDLAQAIPPAYTQHIGRQLLSACEVAA